MDKRSILGLLIIGAILLVFSFFNSNLQPDKTNTPQNDSSATGGQNSQTDNQTANSNLVPKKDSLGHQVIDSLNRWAYIDTVTNEVTFIAPTAVTESIQVDSSKLKLGATSNSPEEIVRLENDLLIIEITNKGGTI